MDDRSQKIGCVDRYSLRTLSNMNLLFIEMGSAYAKDLAHAMERNGIHIQHFTVTNKNNDERKGAIFSPHLFRSSSILKHYGHYFSTLDKTTLEFFLPIERDFMMLTDRAFSRHESFHFRKQLFYDLIRFWTGFLQSSGIDAIYFPCTPHAPWELVLMRAA